MHEVMESRFRMMLYQCMHSVHLVASQVPSIRLPQLAKLHRMQLLLLLL